jgi:prepilin-type N-terminal cleavage/methylation domain-containing protein
VRLLFISCKKNISNHCSTSGFTLPEILVVFLIIGILAALVSPSWLTFVNTQRLSQAQNEVYNAIQQAKSQAGKEKLTWQVSFREQNGTLQLAVHPASVDPAVAKWNKLDGSVRFDEETTLQESNGVKKIQFDYKGNVPQPPLGRITLSSRYGSKTKRCVYISTILGAMRKEKENKTANGSGDYCY